MRSGEVKCLRCEDFFYEGWNDEGPEVWDFPVYMDKRGKCRK